MLRINVRESSRGLTFSEGRKRGELVWPDGVWKKLPARFREVLADNLAHLLTVDLPLIRRADGVALNRPRACFWSQFRTLALGSIPQAVEDGSSSTTAVLGRFRRLQDRFAGDVPRIPPPKRWDARNRAVVLMTPDPEGLASLGLARELALDPVAVCIDETGPSRAEHATSDLAGELGKMGFETAVVTDGVERLGPGKSGLGRMHRRTAFALMALPIAHACRARYIVLPNGQDANRTFVNKDGFLTYPAFDRTSSWTMSLDMMTRTLTGGAVRTMSLIEPLTTSAVTKLLVERYADLASLAASGKIIPAKRRPAKSPFLLHPPGTVPVDLRERLMLILKR